ncbi:MAG: hypothetical protein M0Q51_16005 [Bacteroidales bacterium]|nr:hypothetical protein [Bacteroidales bacterium]
MAVLQKGKSLYPFWGSSVTLITGLDPLGLQVTSEAAYSEMLSGITNLTNRIRYYGFYCWLIDFYFKKEKKGNSTEQYRFIRRAELMIAILMQSERKEVQQITGSNYASNLLNDTTSNYFDLAKGADKDGSEENVYWKYPSGAFGQYYYGAMQILSIVIAAENPEGDVVFSISQPHPRQKVSGKQLADAFDNTLTSPIKELFYNNIKKGKLFKKDISELIKYFAIEAINPKSEEWNLYVQMLMDKDEPSQEVEELMTFHRRDTIISLLNFAIQNKKNYNWYDFLLESYKIKLGSSSNPADETSKGWYCYQLNEYWQYACGAILWAFLQQLNLSVQDQYLPEFLKSFAGKITNDICAFLKHSAEKTSPVAQILPLLPAKDEEEEAIYDEIDTSPSAKPVSAARNGFILLFVLYRNNKDQLHPLKEFMSRKQIIRDGNVADGLLSIHNEENESLEEFVAQFILQKVINRHQMVALRKMGSGFQATHKFLIEEQYIRFIDTFPPRNTSPRMNALKNILNDLQIIDKEGSLLPLHQKLLTV